MRFLQTHAVIFTVVDVAVHRAPIVGQFEAEDHVGLFEQGLGATILEEMMRVRKIHPAFLIDDRRLQGFRKLNKQFHPVCRARVFVCDNHRTFGRRQQLCGLPHSVHVALRRRRRYVARNREFRTIVQCLFLQSGIERDHHRLVWRRHRKLVGAHKRLREMLQRYRLVVPFGEVAHQRVDVLRRMKCRHARRPLGRVKIGAAHHDHGDAVAPGIVDRHRRMLEADRTMAEHQQRFAGNFEITVRHRHRGFLVRAREKFRFLVATVVDQ